MYSYVTGGDICRALRACSSKNIAISLSIALFSTKAVHASEVHVGPVSITANGSVTAGVLVSAEKAGGRWINAKNAELSGTEYSGKPNLLGATSVDDNRLNWEQGDIVSSPITIAGDVRLEYNQFGAFIRGKAWYDYTLENHKVPHGNSLNHYEPNAPLEDEGFHDLAKFKGVELLDAYLYGNLQAGQVPVHIRVGNQVVKWGESRFFMNGINAINPIDVAEFHRPGSRPGDILRPTPLLYFKAGLANNFQLEGFYQLAWKESVLDGCGTFNARIDYLPGACFGVSRNGTSVFTHPTDYNDHEAYAAGSYIDRGPDREPDDHGQFGLALRYSLPEQKTEIGLYAMQVHSREPLPSAVLSTDPAKNDFGNPGWEYNGVDGSTTDSAYYFKDYAEDIRIFGVTAATQIANWSLFGEYSYRPNQPIMYHPGDTVPGVFGPTADLDFAFGAPIADDVMAAAPGSVFKGYGREKVSQLTLGGIGMFPQVLGADHLVIIGEVGMKYVHDLPSLSDVRYGRPDAFGSNLSTSQGVGSAGCNMGVAPQYQEEVCSDDGFVTDLSWAYRIRGQLTYKHPAAGVSLSPFAMFGHDVKGYSHDYHFIEGRLIGNVGIKVDFLADYTVELNYTTTGDAFWAQDDRDTLAVSARMSF